MTKTTFKPTSIQYLYRREPLGVYYARLSRRKRQVWISLRTKVFAVAKVELHKLLSQHFPIVDAEVLIREGKATIGDLATVYLQNVALNGATKATTKEYRSKTVRYLLKSWPTLATMAPARITETDCRQWAAEYRGKFSETLFNNTLDSLRHIFDLAIKRGLVSRNPASSVEKVKVPQKKLELPSGEQFKRIVELIRNAGSATSDGCGDLVEFLAYSGLRATEAAGVRWQDIDFERSHIYAAPGKTGQARYVPLLDSMRKLLERIQASPRWFRAEHRRKAGYILSVSECEKALTSACAKAGAHRMTRHDLRHLYATRCIESGVDIPTVSRWLGHKDGGSLAMKVYGHLRDSHSREMAAKVTF
jgi:integrase